MISFTNVLFLVLYSNVKQIFKALLKVLLTLSPDSRPHQTSNADSPKSAVQTRRRAAGASRQHQDTAPDRSSILWEIPDDQRRTDLSLALLPVSE